MTRKTTLKVTLGIVNLEEYDDQMIITFSRFIAKCVLETLRGQLDGIVFVTGMTQNVVIVQKHEGEPWTEVLPKVKSVITSVFGPVAMDDSLTRDCVCLVEDDDLADIREQFREEDVALTVDERESLGFND